VSDLQQRPICTPGMRLVSAWHALDAELYVRNCCPEGPNISPKGALPPQPTERLRLYFDSSLAARDNWLKQLQDGSQNCSLYKMISARSYGPSPSTEPRDQPNETLRIPLMAESCQSSMISTPGSLAGAVWERTIARLQLNLHPATNGRSLALGAAFWRSLIRADNL